MLSISLRQGPCQRRGEDQQSLNLHAFMSTDTLRAKISLRATDIVRATLEPSN